MSAPDPVGHDAKNSDPAASTLDPAPSILDFGSASHELRAPLHAILGLAELLVERASDGDRTGSELARRIYEEARAMEIVLSDLLEFSRLESHDVALIIEPFSPRVVVDEATGLHKEHAHAKGLDLRLDIGDDTPLVVRGDRFRLRQIVVNLVSNAVKYTASGGVTIGLANHGTPEAPVLKLWVADTGPGIPEQALPNLYTPFTQARSGDRDKGTGLGLAITRRLVEAMNGALDLDTSPQGTRFTVELPFLPARRMQDQSAVAGVPVRPLTSTLARKKVLVVDDTEVNRLLATSQLDRLGYEPLAVDSGLEALATLAGEPVDAVLMDWHMPNMDGLEVTRRWRQVSSEDGYDGPNREVPIIALTASALANDRAECLAAGMNDYLAKPVGLETLGTCLARWLPDETGDGRNDRDSPASSSGEPSPSNPTVNVDPDRLTALIRDLGAEAVTSVVTAFLVDLPGRADAMQTAAYAQQIDVIRRTAHTVKSSAALFGAEQLRAVCTDLERVAGGGPACDPGELDRLVQDFIGLVEPTVRALERHLQNEPSMLEGSTS